MKTTHDPNPVFARMSPTFTQGVEVVAGARMLFVSRQIGVFDDGRTADGFPEQCDQAWRNLVETLEAAGIGIDNLVKVTAFLTRQEDVSEFRRFRDRVLSGVRTAATIVVTSALADPTWLVEIEAVAAAPPGQ